MSLFSTENAFELNLAYIKIMEQELLPSHLSKKYGEEIREFQLRIDTIVMNYAMLLNDLEGDIISHEDAKKVVSLRIKSKRTPKRS